MIMPSPSMITALLHSYTEMSRKGLIHTTRQNECGACDGIRSGCPATHPRVSVAVSISLTLWSPKFGDLTEHGVLLVPTEYIVRSTEYSVHLKERGLHTLAWWGVYLGHVPLMLYYMVHLSPTSFTAVCHWRCICGRLTAKQSWSGCSHRFLIGYKSWKRFHPYI